MRKPTLLILPVVMAIVSIFTFCDKKADPAPVTNADTGSPSASPSSSVVIRSTPVYMGGSTGTSANPNINVVTVTGTSTLTNPATQNSMISVGNSLPGWSFDACATSPNTLTGHNGSCTIQITFGGSSIAAMNYAFTAGIPAAGQARMIITDAPGQPQGVVWYAKNGMVSVATGTSGTTASFSNIQCLQQNFLFPVVTASGNLSCI
jgi:hypothetical protein